MIIPGKWKENYIRDVEGTRDRHARQHEAWPS